MISSDNRVLVGTSGYSFEDWKGRFYPERLSSSDMLRYYSERFPMVEVNYTYYRMPSVSTMRGMERKTPDDFEFVVKLNRSLTHSNPIIGSFIPDQESSPDAARGTPDAKRAAPGTRELRLSLDPLKETIAGFKEGIAPLVEAGKLTCLLAQFPWGFRNTDRNLEYVVTLAQEFGEFLFVVEFRNAEWVSDTVFGVLKDCGIGFCCVDEPRLKGLMPPIAVSTSPEVSYVRFHGRNSSKWWNHDDPSERYDYLYDEEELKPWADKILKLADNSRKTYVLFNNCFEAKATQNARQMQSLLGLVQTYERPLF